MGAWRENHIHDELLNHVSRDPEYGDTYILWYSLTPVVRSRLDLVRYPYVLDLRMGPERVRYLD